jgi:hypothetical protein
MSLASLDLRIGGRLWGAPRVEAVTHGARVYLTQTMGADAAEEPWLALARAGTLA